MTEEDGFDMDFDSLQERPIDVLVYSRGCGSIKGQFMSPDRALVAFNALLNRHSIDYIDMTTLRRANPRWFSTVVSNQVVFGFDETPSGGDFPFTPNIPLQDVNTEFEYVLLFAAKFQYQFKGFVYFHVKGWEPFHTPEWELTACALPKFELEEDAILFAMAYSEAESTKSTLYKMRDWTAEWIRDHWFEVRRWGVFEMYCPQDETPTKILELLERVKKASGPDPVLDKDIFGVLVKQGVPSTEPDMKLTSDPNDAIDLFDMFFTAHQLDVSYDNKSWMAEITMKTAQRNHRGERILGVSVGEWSKSMELAITAAVLANLQHEFTRLLPFSNKDGAASV